MDRVSVCGDEKILETDSDDCCAILLKVINATGLYT